jgi:hypothetical protein
LFFSSVRFSDGTFNRGLSTLYKSSCRSTFEERVEGDKLDNLTSRLDLQRLDVIKIDVEGGELSVIRSGADTLRKFRPVLIVEINRERCQSSGISAEFLIKEIKSMGYSIHLLASDGHLAEYSETNDFDVCDIVARPK